MLKTRVIPVLLLKDGLLVRSEDFRIHQFIGDPWHEMVRFNEWNVDEIIYLDISSSDSYLHGRDDTKIKRVHNLQGLLPLVSESCFVPLTFGGRIKCIDDVRWRLMQGADKVSINTAAIQNPRLIEESADKFGSQSIIVSIDAKKNRAGDHEVFVQGGSIPTGLSLVAWAQQAEKRGAGEILLQSIDHDGRASGFDCEMIESVVSSVSIPVIAMGGAGSYHHFSQVVNSTGVSAVAAANIFHFKEMADRYIKKEMKASGIPVRSF
jgi:cyclase